MNCGSIIFEVLGINICDRTEFYYNFRINVMMRFGWEDFKFDGLIQKKVMHHLIKSESGKTNVWKMLAQALVVVILTF